MGRAACTDFSLCTQGALDSTCHTCRAELRAGGRLGSRHAVESGIYSKFLALSFLKRKEDSVEEGHMKGGRGEEIEEREGGKERRRKDEKQESN